MKPFPSVEQLIALAKPDRVAISTMGNNVAYSQLIANHKVDQFDRVLFLYDSELKHTQTVIKQGNIKQLLWYSDVELLLLWDESKFTGKYHLYRYHTLTKHLTKLLPDAIEKIALLATGIIAASAQTRSLLYLSDSSANHINSFDFSAFGNTVLNLVSTKKSPAHCFVTIIKKPYNIILTLNVCQHQLTVATAYSLLIHDAQVMAADQQTNLYLQGRKQVKRYQQYDLWQLASNAQQLTCLSQNIDFEVIAIGYSKKGLLVRYVNGLNAQLAYCHQEHITPLELGELNARVDVDITPAGDLAFIAQSANSYPEIYLKKANEHSCQAISNNAQQIKPFNLGLVDLFTWQLNDGTTLQGAIRTASNITRQKPRPLAIVLHGGPADCAEQQLFSDYHWFAPYLQLLAQDYIILEPNYRGSIGRGQQFMQASVGALGIHDLEDIESAIAAVAQSYLIDNSKIVCIGWSQGGFIAAYGAFQSTRFSKVCLGAAISNWQTYHQHTDIPGFVEDYLAISGTNDKTYREKIHDCSATTKPPKHNPSTLIIHGRDDDRVPFHCGQELEDYCVAHDIPHKTCFIDGLKHRIALPSHMQTILNTSLAWLKQ